LIRDWLRDPDVRAVLLCGLNLVGGYFGSRLTLAQVKRAARTAAAAAVAPVRSELATLSRRVESSEKFLGHVKRFMRAREEGAKHG
jgi:hypothetical protein